MSSTSDDPTVDDPYDLGRFLAAHERDYERALTEIKAGFKRTHWMWYIFPQVDGLGFSPTAKHYAIANLDEAQAYLAHPVLGPRLVACAEAALAVEGRTATDIFGEPDDLKLRSSATLFASVSPPGSVFHRLLEGHPERGPVFSMASIIKPGSFDMGTIRELETPAIAFFLTLPAPVPALDAWEKMLPTVQRMAELLDGVVLDDSRNALGRQRIAHIRDELRAYDRQHEAPPLTRAPRW